jgi:hypothetical protein
MAGHRGAYNVLTAYAQGDLVTHQNSTWVALQATTGDTPPTLPTTSSAYWQLVAQKGADSVLNLATPAIDNPANLYDSTTDLDGWRLSSGVLTTSGATLQTTTGPMVIAEGDIVFVNRRIARYGFYSDTAGTTVVSSGTGRPLGGAPATAIRFRLEFYTAEKTGAIVTLNSERIPDETLRPELLAGTVQDGNNLIDPTRLITAFGLSSTTDNFSATGAAQTTHHIPVTAGETLYLGRAATIHWKKSDFQWVVPGNAASSVLVQSAFPAELTVPASTTYVQLSFADSVAGYQYLSRVSAGAQTGRTANQHALSKDWYPTVEWTRFAGKPIVWGGDSQSVDNSGNSFFGPPRHFGKLVGASELYNVAKGGSAFSYRSLTDPDEIDDAAYSASVAMCRAITTWPDISGGYVIAFAGGADALDVNGVDEGTTEDFGLGIDTTFRGGFETFIQEFEDKYTDLTQLIIIWTLPSDPPGNNDAYGDIAAEICERRKIEFHRPDKTFRWPPNATTPVSPWLDGRHILGTLAEWLAKYLYEMLRSRPSK